VELVVAEEKALVVALAVTGQALGHLVGVQVLNLL
jgi:hypothetical protein